MRLANLGNTGPSKPALAVHVAPAAVVGSTCHLSGVGVASSTVGPGAEQAAGSEAQAMSYCQLGSALKWCWGWAEGVVRCTSAPTLGCLRSSWDGLALCFWAFTSPFSSPCVLSRSSGRLSPACDSVSDPDLTSCALESSLVSSKQPHVREVM